MTFSLNFKSLNWKVIVLFVLILFYSGLMIIWSSDKIFPIYYGGDYLAFWSAGKLADEKGFSAIYNVADLQIIQVQVLESLGFPENGIGVAYSPIPAPIFSLFMIPFKYLSRINIEVGFWIWSVLNILILTIYFIIFLRAISSENTSFGKVLIPFLLLASFLVFDTLVNGQLNVLLVLSCGEFVRNAIKKKPLLSGIWLSGMLIKPQVLILIVPILFIQRYWKALFGFVSSSVIVIFSSLALSGWSGIKALLGLWTEYSAGMATNAPESMINWRMIGVYINSYLGSPYGWIIAIIGILITLVAVYFLIRRRTEFGSPEWVFVILGVMSATLAVTWHAHAHMAVVIIPLLLYAAINKWLPEKYVVAWAGITPIAWIIVLILGAAVQLVSRTTILDYQRLVLALSGFIVNLLIFGLVDKVILRKNAQRI